MSSNVDLKQLRSQPFELLLELERRCRTAAVGQNVAGSAVGEWVGIGIRVGTLSFVVARSEVREILEYPPVTVVPRAKPWVLGLANVRGQLLPIFDLSGFVAGRPIRPDRRARVISVSHPEVPAGFAVDEVFGFRRFNESDYRDHAQTNLESGLEGFSSFLAGSFARAGDEWPLLSLNHIIESVSFSQAAESA